MDFFKISEWASKYLADYFTVFFSVLKNPAPTRSSVDDKSASKLNSDLMGFALISITIGTTINSVFPNPPAKIEVLTTSIITLIMWIVYSMVIFTVLALLRSQTSFLDVLTNSLQLFGTIYVVSNLLAFLWGMATINPFFSTIRDVNPIIKMIFDRPFLAFYFFQVILLFFYLPKVLSRLNGLGSLRVVSATFIALSFIFFCGFSPYLSDLFMQSLTISGDGAYAISQQKDEAPNLVQLFQSMTSTPAPPETPTDVPIPMFNQGPLYIYSISYGKSTSIHPDSDCKWAGIGGTVVDVEGTPIIGVVVALRGFLNGEPLDLTTVSGVNKEYGESGFEFVLKDGPVASNNSLYLQLLDLKGEPLSAKVDLTTYSECEKNLVIVKLSRRY